MKKTSIAIALAASIMALTSTSAFAEMNPTSHAIAKATDSDVMEISAADSDAVRLHFAGAERLHWEFPGGLTVFQASGRMHYRPEAYQLINGKIKPVEVNIHIDGKDQATVQFGKLDKSAPVFLKRGALMFNEPARM